ncbi:unnamed protein product, partial [Staurois parvus]
DLIYFIPKFFILHEKAKGNFIIFYDHFRGGLTTHGAPRAIGDHGASVSLPKLKKAYEKGTRGISWGPLMTLGPRAVPK